MAKITTIRLHTVLLLSLSFLTAVFFLPVLIQGKTFYAFDTLFGYLPWSTSGVKITPHNPLITDPVNIYYPYYHFIKNHFTINGLTFWKDSNFLGVPITSFGGQPIELACYALLPLSVAHDMVLGVHLFLSGLFMWLYLKELTLKNCSCAIGTVAWMFNGYVMVWFEFQNVILMAPTFAATLFFLERWLKYRTHRSLVGWITAIGFSITAGYAPLLFFQTIFIGAYAIYRYISLRRSDFPPPRMGGRTLFALIAGAVVILLISSTFLISHLFFIEDAQRVKFELDSLARNTGQVLPNYLTTLLFPDFFGSPAIGLSFPPRLFPTQTYNNYNELCLYCGIPILFLSMTCVGFIFRRPLILLYLITAISTLSMAMGSFLYYPLARWIPGLNLSTPTRTLYVFGFCVCVLAAIGADTVLTLQKPSARRRAAFIWIATFSVGLLIALWVQTPAGVMWSLSLSGFQSLSSKSVEQVANYLSWTSPAIQWPMALMTLTLVCLLCLVYWRRMALRPVFGYLIVGITACDLMIFAINYNTTTPRNLEFPETGAIQFLKQDRTIYRVMMFGNFMHNSLAPFGIQDAGGYASFYPKRYAEFLFLLNNGPNTPLPNSVSRWVLNQTINSPMMDLINVKYLLFPPDALVSAPNLELVYDNEIKIYKNLRSFPRAFFIPKFHVANSKTAAYHSLGTFSTDDFRSMVLLEAIPPEMPTTENNLPMSARTTIAHYQQDHLEIDVSTPNNGFVVVSNNYHRSWKARIDGKATTVLRANYTMLAVRVPAGTHRVVFDYSPPILLTGIILTSAGWLVLMTAIVWLVSVPQKNTPQLECAPNRCH